MIVLVNSDKYKNDCSGPTDISNPFSPKMIAEIDKTMPLQYRTKRFTIDSPHNIVHQNQCSNNYESLDIFSYNQTHFYK